MKMNPEIKARWVAALRSGKYKQVAGKLRGKGNEFCCLGVLCNLHAQANPEIAAYETRPNFYLGESECLPDEVSEWAQVEDGNGPVVRIGTCDLPLAAHNDGTWNGRKVPQRTFAEIADAIEAQL